MRRAGEGGEGRESEAGGGREGGRGEMTWTLRIVHVSGTFFWKKKSLDSYVDT